MNGSSNGRRHTLCLSRLCLVLMVLGAFGVTPLLAADVTVQKLDGSRLKGRLELLTSEELQLSTANGTQPLSVAELQRLETGVRPQKVNAPVVLTLENGSVVGCQSVSYTPEKLQLTLTEEGELNLNAIRPVSCQFPQGREQPPELWNNLATRERSNDLLIIRKADRFDFVAGVVSEIGAESLQFLFDKRTITVPLNRVYGIWFREIANTKASPVEVKLSNGNRWFVNQASYQSGQWSLQYSGTSNLQVKEDRIVSIDFSGGRITTLQSLTPTVETYDSLFDVSWPMTKGENLEGEPLQLGGQKYNTGISLHSWSRVRYAIDGRYARFQALVGIDDQTRNWGDVTFTIRGDGQTLFQQEILGTDDVVDLDLNLTGIRDLELTVDYGSSKSPIGDRLNLVNARLLKEQ